MKDGFSGSINRKQPLFVLHGWKYYVEMFFDAQTSLFFAGSGSKA